MNKEMKGFIIMASLSVFLWVFALASSNESRQDLLAFSLVTCGFALVLLSLALSESMQNQKIIAQKAELTTSLAKAGFYADKIVAVPSKKSSLHYDNFLIDLNNKKFLLVQAGNQTQSNIYQFADIIGYQIVEDGLVVQEGAASKAMAGVSGAVLAASTRKKVYGYCTELTLHIKLNNINNPLMSIAFIKLNALKTSEVYKRKKQQIYELAALVELMMHNKHDKQD